MRLRADLTFGVQGTVGERQNTSVVNVQICKCRDKACLVFVANFATVAFCSNSICWNDTSGWELFLLGRFQLLSQATTKPYFFLF